MRNKIIQIAKIICSNIPECCKILIKSQKFAEKKTNNCEKNSLNSTSKKFSNYETKNSIMTKIFCNRGEKTNIFI